MLRPCSVLCGCRSVLPQLLRRVTDHRVALTLDDIYKLCVLLKDKNDPLGLRISSGFAASLAAQYHKPEVKDAASPFQRSVIDAVLPPSDEKSSSNAATTTITSSNAVSSATVSGEPTIAERLSALWAIVREATEDTPAGGGKNGEDVSSSSSSGRVRVSASFLQLQACEAHVVALEGRLRELTPHELCTLVKVLTIVGYQNSAHTALLARRCCEVAAQLPRKELCLTYLNLHKLHTHDSCTALVNHILPQVTELAVDEIYAVAQAIERQTSTSSFVTRLVHALATRAAQEARHASGPAYHRTVLVALSRYMLEGHHAILPLLRDLERFDKTLGERDVLALLQACRDLRVPASHPTVSSNEQSVYTRLLTRLEALVPVLELTYVDATMDLLSTVPADPSPVMRALMTRLEDDAGKLGAAQLVHVVNLLASYPPARGSVALVSLAFAAAQRAHTLSASALDDLVVSFALVQQMTDDFTTLLAVLVREKGGLRSFESLQTLLRQLTREALCDDQLRSLVVAATLAMAPSLSDPQLAQCRTLLSHVGLNDRDLHQRLCARHARQSTGWTGARQRGRPQRRHSSFEHDPVDDLV